MDKQFHGPIRLADLDISQKQGTKAPSRPYLNKPELNTEQLFGTAREVVIVHKGEEYRLCITRNGKLILTK
jgi:hemin uptake protein HemP